VWLEGLGKLKKSNVLIWNLTRNLPVCSTVPEPTMLSRADEDIGIFFSNLPNPSNRTVALVSTQPLTVMSSGDHAR
jgi:hypothetical protein